MLLMARSILIDGDEEDSARLNTVPNPNLTVVIPAFRDAKRAADAARAMLQQTLPAGLALQVVVVDDCSCDGTTEYLNSLGLSALEVLALPSNLGRSGARNTGAQIAQGEVVAFMDSDCLPVDAHWLANHYTAYQDPLVVAVTGGVIGFDKGFWSRFQLNASERRRKQHSRGAVFSGSSQNLSVRKAAFDRIGGFDTAFTEYGFEDRDLLLRLSKIGSVSWTTGATVIHRDQVDMISISKKMRLAGGSSAEQFGKRHPLAYRELGYAHFDARIHPLWKSVGGLLRNLVPSCAVALQKAISARLLPFAVATQLVRMVNGLSFTAGSLDALADRREK
jgi:glycosyltransferase involved in cell wall biosynthesis